MKSAIQIAQSSAILHIREIATGAFFLIPIGGNLMRMSGLTKTSASESVYIVDNGVN